MKLFINLSITINRRVDDGEDVLLFTAGGSVTYIDATENKQVVEIGEITSGFKNGKIKIRPQAVGHHT